MEKNLHLGLEVIMLISVHYDDFKIYAAKYNGNSFS